MYKGKHKTAVKSQKIIAEAFFDILMERSYYDVSIKEICAKAGISRQTFYSLFGTKEDVIKFYLTETFNQWRQQAKTNGVNSLYDLILFFLMGISATLVYESHCKYKKYGLLIYGVQLVFNFLWSMFFFLGEQFVLSFGWLTILIFMVVGMILLFL